MVALEKRITYYRQPAVAAKAWCSWATKVAQVVIGGGGQESKQRTNLFACVRGFIQCTRLWRNIFCITVAGGNKKQCLLDPSAAADRRIRRLKFVRRKSAGKLRRAELAAEFC